MTQMRQSAETTREERRCCRSRSVPLGLAVLAFLGLGACEVAPPVQEMSDARQAIEVAREAGAEAHARPELYEALRHLKEAEHELDVEDYAQARRSALQAKTKAQEARQLSEQSRPR